MAKGKSGSSVGSWAFLIGVILAILFSFIALPGLHWLLVILGLIIGLLNITESETSKFLMAGTVLVIVGSFGADGLSEVAFLPAIFGNLVTLFATSTILVALKSVFELARN